MSSNQLSERVSSAMKKEVSQLLARAVWFYPCPLKTKLDVATAWRSLFEPRILEAYDQLERHHYDMSSCSTRHMGCTFDDWTVWFRMHSHEGDDPNQVIRSKTTAYRSMQFMEARRTMFNGTCTNWEEFETWMKHAGELSAACTAAGMTFAKVVKLANTPGQLVRMFPDARRYMSYDVGTRQSQLSVEGTQYMIEHAEDLRNLSATLAKCYLLPVAPDPHKNMLFEQAIDYATWVTPKT